MDIGCNEGFFCDFCLQQGASKVVGIDLNPAVVNSAKQRFPDIQFKNMSWWDLSIEKFDVILFLSASHYEKDQRKLFDFLADRLTCEGTLVLECGVAPDGDGVDRAWTYISRHDQDLRYPSMDYLTNSLLRRYAVRPIGPSVNQDGDPMPRYVFHCRPMRPIAMIIAGSSYSGKTILSKTLGRNRIKSYSVDDLILRMVERPELYFRSKMCESINKNNIQTENLEMVGAMLHSKGLISEFTQRILSELPLEDDIFCVEGAALTNVDIRDQLTRALTERGVVVWSVARQS